MANDTTVSFKASLDLGEKTEVRRFVLDHQTVASFESLENKLRVIFPALRNKTFSITWKDKDNDFVIISSDDELIISLFEMRDDPRRLYITVNGRISARAEAQGDAATHEGVVCDACDGPVRGYRYKCVQCPDFDLCATCEGHGNHPEHVMMRIPYPLAMNLSKRMSHHLEKKISRCVEKMEKLEKGRFEGQCSSPRKGKRGHKHRESDMPHAEEGLIRSIIDTVLNVKDNSRDECLDENPMDKNKCKSKKRPFVVSFADCPAFLTTEHAAKEHTESSKDSEQRNSHDTLLRTIGQVIASVLDPLGIDVDVDVRTKSTSEQNAKAEGTGQTAEPSPTAQATGETTETHAVPHDEAKQSETPMSEGLEDIVETDEVMDTEQAADSEWTLVDDSMDEGAIVDVNVASSSPSCTIDFPNRTENANNEANGEVPPVAPKGIASSLEETVQAFKAIHEARLRASQTHPEFVSTTPPKGIFSKPVPHSEEIFSAPKIQDTVPSGPFFYPPSSEINFQHMAEELHKYLNNNMVSATENAKSTALNIGKPATSAASNISNTTTSGTSNISSTASDAANIAATTAANIAAGAASAAANAFGLLYPNLTTVHMGNKPSPLVGGNIYTDIIKVDTHTPPTTLSSSPTKISTGNDYSTLKSQTAHIGKQTGAINKQPVSPRSTQSPSVPFPRRPAPVAGTQVPIAVTPVPTAPTQQAVHPDPRIAQALNIMMAMGFTNEGGWLSTVLEQAGGDVNKAIDLLQPVGKK